MALVFSILNALVAIPKIAGFVEALASAVTSWWVQRQSAQTLTAISDAAALASRAQTDLERYVAAQAWRDALSRPRTTA